MVSFMVYNGFLVVTWHVYTMCSTDVYVCVCMRVNVCKSARVLARVCVRVLLAYVHVHVHVHVLARVCACVRVCCMCTWAT